MAMTVKSLKAAIVAIYKAQRETTTTLNYDLDGNVSGKTETEGDKVMSTEMEELFDAIAGAVVAQLLDEGVALGVSTATELDVG